jgi:hypothetical protein
MKTKRQQELDDGWDRFTAFSIVIVVLIFAVGIWTVFFGSSCLLFQIIVSFLVAIGVLT